MISTKHITRYQQVCKYKSMQVSEYESKQNLHICQKANVSFCRYANMHVCKNASNQEWESTEVCMCACMQPW